LVCSNSWLVAEGTPTERITIKGLNDVAGYWGYINISSQMAGSKINYCDISGGGGNTSYRGLFYMYSGAFNNARVELNNTTFSRSQRYGMFLDWYDASSKCLITTADSTTVTFGTGADGCVDGNIAQYVSPILVGVHATLADYLTATGQ